MFRVRWHALFPSISVGAASVKMSTSRGREEIPVLRSLSTLATACVIGCASPTP